ADREPAVSRGGRTRLVDGPGGGVGHARRARRRVRLHVGRVALGDPGRALDLQGAAADPLFPGQYGIRALPPDTPLPGRVPTPRGSASPAVRRAGGLLLVVGSALP